MAAQPGTIPALPVYQPGALTITGQEIVEIASSQNATTAASYQMLITDLVGKAPSGMIGATPVSGDLIAFFQVSTNLPRFTTVSALSSGGGTTGTTSTVQRSITTVSFTALASDRFLNINIAAAATCTLASYSLRSGVPLTFKDVSGAASTNHITINTFGAETIDGQSSFVMTNNYQAVTINPFTDGVNTGWFIT